MPKLFPYKRMSVPESRIADIYIIGKPDCIFCKKAKDLLDKNSLDYEYYSSCTESKYVRNIMEKLDYHKFPIIFYKGDFIGGFTELNEKLASGELDRLGYDDDF
ncbi:Glutaredoxin [Trachipleistophora hominis]|uniref:Glutaredoxin n=1 Tax=Trachipleistophora hominis TaxID=72359 RepID=L7JV64_TRAHO|nr:Glutaredoxin [Trachipleistophora hominis]